MRYPPGAIKSVAKLPKEGQPLYLVMNDRYYKCVTWGQGESSTFLAGNSPHETIALHYEISEGIFDIQSFWLGDVGLLKGKRRSKYYLFTNLFLARGYAMREKHERANPETSVAG